MTAFFAKLLLQAQNDLEKIDLNSGSNLEQTEEACESLVWGMDAFDCLQFSQNLLLNGRTIIDSQGNY